MIPGLNTSQLNDFLLNGGQFNPNSSSTDGLCIASISNYKWLTPALITTQGLEAVRPYFSCKIVDDLVVPHAILTPPGQPLNGSAVQTPDGQVVAVGKISSTGFLGFWKTADASTGWASPTAILDATSGTTVSNGYRGDMNAAISVSEYINGTYSIDVYYFKTIASTSLSIAHQYSNDGGVTWNTNINPNPPFPSMTASQSSYVAAGKPYVNLAGTIVRVLFYINSGTTDNIHYQYYDGQNGSTFNADTSWGTKNINSTDWRLSSLDTYYNNNEYGKYYVVFSGYHIYQESTNGNFSIYQTSFETTSVTVNTSVDIWDYPREIIASLSGSTLNQNTFSFPKANFDGTSVWLTFKGVVVSSVSSATSVADPNSTVTTSTEYYICASRNFIDFSYPTPIIFTDGTMFNDTVGNDFVLNNGFYYLLGNGNLWQYSQNNIVADVTNDVISYSVQDQAGQPSSISLSIGNQNNQWFGTSPTGSGAAAIAKDRKIFLDQGYYVTPSTPQSVPRNIFFIDDIQQNVDSTSNDLIIQARCLRRHQQILISSYTYNYNGCSFYNDIFDGTTVSNWTPQSGSWEQSSNSYVSLNTQSGAPGYDPGLEAILTLSQTDLFRSSSLLSLSCLMPQSISGTDTFITIYAFYQDPSNYLRLRIAAVGSSQTYLNYYVETSQGGSTGINGPYAINTSQGSYCPILIRKYGYGTFVFLVGLPSATGNDIANYANATVISGGEFSFAPGPFNNGVWTRGSVGFGSQNINSSFKYMKYIQYSDSLSIKDLLQSIGTKPRIYDYMIENDFTDPLFFPSVFTGTYSITNRIMNVNSTNLVIKQKDFPWSSSDLLIDNGEVAFTAKLTPNAAGDYGMDVIFRDQSSANANATYFWNISQQTVDGTSETTSRFKIVTNSGSTTSVLMSSSVKDYTNIIPETSSLDLDLTEYHRYKLVMSDGWMHGFIDDILVLSWNDNNVETNYTTGYIGWRANANTSIQLKDIAATTFWKQMESYSINPNDDFETPADNLVKTLKGWNYSDNLGRFKTIEIEDTDPVTYTYADQILIQATDNSAKEYSNRVTVYGNNVMAQASDQSSIGTNAILRNTIIVDYKITSYQDALTRANNELSDMDKFNNQSSITQINNVGSEMFDVITVDNTGGNTSGVDSNLRVYNQTFTIGGNTTYSLKLQAGNVS